MAADVIHKSEINSSAIKNEVQHINTFLVLCLLIFEGAFDVFLFDSVNGIVCHRLKTERSKIHFVIGKYGRNRKCVSAPAVDERHILFLFLVILRNRKNSEVVLHSCELMYE